MIRRWAFGPALGVIALAAGGCGGGGGGSTEPSAGHVSLVFDDQKDRCVHWDVHPIEPLVLSNELLGASLFALNQPGARFASFDTTTLTPQFEIPIGPGAASLAERAGTHEVWITDRVTGSVTVVDRVTRAITATIRVGAGPHGLAFSGNGDRCYVACSDVDRVDVIDPSTYRVVMSIPVPVKEPRSIVCAGGVAWVAPLLSGNDTAPLGSTSSGPGVDSIAAVGVTQLPDRDLIAIPVGPNPATDAVDPTRTVRGLGTILFNLHARPGSSELWIPNTDALNAVHTGSKNFVAGEFMVNRVTIVDASGATAPRVVDLDQLAPSGVRCAQPTGLAFDPVRARVYVCGYGSDLVAVLDLSGPTPTWAGSVALPYKQTYPRFTGPRTCVVDAAGHYLYVFNKGDNSLSRVDVAALPAGSGFAVTAPDPVTLGFEPTSGEERQGRNHFINARNSKSLSNSCASCHVDGRADGLVWELSDFLDPEGTPDDALAFPLDVKGPLVTQSAHRLAESGPYHWRGERERLVDFNPTFVELLEKEVGGVSKNLGPEFRYLEHYIKRLAIPANPREALDRSLSPLEQRGADLFAKKRVFGDSTCATCHALPLGTSGEVTKSHVAGPFDVADVTQLRGLVDTLAPSFAIGGAFGTRTETGAGLSHGGAFATVRDLLLAPHPTQPGKPAFDLTPDEADALAAFLSVFDTGLAPATAYQATANVGNLPTFFADHLAFLLSQAELGNCDLIYRDGVSPQGASLSGLYDRKIHAFRTARVADAPLTSDALLARVAQGRPITFIGVPGLMGRPMAIDRDMDGLCDQDELDHGTDPEELDTDDDGFPDGYEVKWGLNPLVDDASSPDTTAPKLVAAPKVIYATTNTIKFEFETDEVCRVQISYNGGIPVQRLPLQNDFDFEFSVVLNELQPASNYAIDFELKDPAGNVVHVPFQASTKPLVFGDAAHVDDLALAIAPTATGEELTATVALRTGPNASSGGYQVTLAVYFRAHDGTLSTLATNTVAVTDAQGRAVATFALPAQGPANPGELFVVVRGVKAPAGQPFYAAPLDRETSTSIVW
ncbi:MAG: YncE family protein [Planctomycetes bacterium]|nr:YncE family protein [Planctomycetota bacterium]